MSVSDDENTPIRELRAVLGDATANEVTTEHAVAALAELDYRRAVEWLVAHRDALAASIPSAALGRLLGRLLADGPRESTIPPDELLDLLDAYAEVLTADSLAAGLGAPEVLCSRRGQVLLGRAVGRHPDHAGLLRLMVQQASLAGDGERFHEGLTRLGRADPSQATVHSIRRRRSDLPDIERPKTRIALLASFTVDPLVSYLDLEVRSLGLTPNIYVAPFNSWAQEIIAPDSGLYQSDPEIVFLAVAGDDLIPALDGPMSVEELDEAANQATERLCSVVRHFCSTSDAVLVVHSLHSAHRDPSGPAAGHGAPDRAVWFGELNRRLADELRELPRVRLLDTQDVLMRRRGGELDNPKMRLLAGMRLVGPALAAIARAYVEYLAPTRGLTRKCVVLDLDNTLWGGVVGEDGPRGIRLGDTSPGAEYREFQRYLKTLADRGLLLAISSKNNPDDALEVIRSHDGMVLREDDFTAVRINWEPKPENLLALADELNIGVDSLVFVDDNPHERELMRQALPEVLTPELPADPALYRDTLENLPELQNLIVTETDQTRVGQYRSKRQRDELRETTDLDSYLRSLEIVVRISEADETSLPRVHQLFQRTNQFNLTSRRYDAGDLSSFSDAGGWRLYTLRAQDRFGDHGLVAVALVKLAGETWTIDSFLMSCRVISYGIETALLSIATSDAREAGATRIVGELVETPKNAPARALYQQHGFTSAGSVDGVHRWQLSLPDAGVATPPWITIERPSDAT